MNGHVSLADLAVGSRARIINVVARAKGAGEKPCDLETRLLEIGFAEGDEIEVAHTGPFGRDPLAIRQQGGMVALRRSDARQIVVAPLDH